MLTSASPTSFIGSVEVLLFTATTVAEFLLHVETVFFGTPYLEVFHPFPKVHNGIVLVTNWEGLVGPCALMLIELPYKANLLWNWVRHTWLHAAWKRPILSQRSCPCCHTYDRGYCECNNIWTPYLGQSLAAKAETVNPWDKFAVAVLPDDNIVGRLSKRKLG